jgi:long-chain fatty acid transport protein
MRNLFKSLVIFTFVVSMTLGLHANGLNLNGNGSKAISMGGAFIGLADDFSAVYWNPAGLTQMKEASLALFATDVIPKGTYEWETYGIDAATTKSHYPSPGLGYFKPLSEKVVAGIYVHVPSGIGARYDGADLAILTGGGVFDWDSMLGVISISPAVAFKVSDKFSLGVAANINYGMLKMKKPTALGQYDEDLNGIAFSATLGMLFKPSEKFSLGVSFKTPMKVKLKGDVNMPGAALLGLPGTDEGEREATFPMFLGAGIAIKPTDKLTLTADVQYINWKKLDTIPMSFTNAGWITFLEAGSAIELEWKDAVQLRFGMEYKVSDSFALRAGYYRDPSPSPKSTINILLPEHTYNFFTCGFGYDSGKIVLDVCLEYGTGSVEVGLGEGDFPGKHGMTIFTPNISLTIRL